jgi:type IV pilus assembly protein PilZ
MSEPVTDLSRPLEFRDSVPAAASAAVPGAAAASAPASGPTPRPGVVQLSIKEKAALYAAYMPFVAGGGLFVPTTRPGRLGDEIYVILSLMDDPAKLAITGKVVWVTPPGTPGRQQGIGIQFNADDAGNQARARIENLIGGSLKSVRQTHTI